MCEQVFVPDVQATVAPAFVKARMFFADLIARITFSFTTGMVIELLSGMSLKQMLLSRATNMPLVMLMARPYGIYRDWTLKKFGAMDRKVKPWRWGIINMVCYATFFVPQYAAVLWFEKATPDQIIKASGSVALLSLLLGVVFGYWLDWFRHKLFRIEKPAEKPLPK